jgi:LEA14-like dessication related protein
VSFGLLPIPVGVVSNNPIMTMPGIHLSGLRPHLVILTPVLFNPDRRKATYTFHITRAEKVHAFILMVIDVKRINQESRIRDNVRQIGNKVSEAVLDIDTI